MTRSPSAAFSAASTCGQASSGSGAVSAVRITPGARILDESNRNLRSASLVNRELTVNYLMDRQGQITQVWILSEAEKKERRRTLGVERNFSFESQQGAAQPATLPATR